MINCSVCFSFLNSYFSCISGYVLKGFCLCKNEIKPFTYVRLNVMIIIRIGDSIFPFDVFKFYYYYYYYAFPLFLPQYSIGKCAFPTEIDLSFFTTHFDVTFFFSSIFRVCCVAFSKISILVPFDKYLSRKWKIT